MNKLHMAIIAMTLVIGVLIGIFFPGFSDIGGKHEGDNPNDEILFYRNPMNPDVTSPVPAKDSMGMDYIPVYADESRDSSKQGTVSIDPVVVQNMGVRTTEAVKMDLGRTVRAVGRVSFDEQRIAKLHPKVEAWVGSIRVDKTGETVKKNDILLNLYSPKLVATQQEYLLAINNLENLKDSKFPDIRQNAQSLVKNSRERLELLDVSDHQIKELEVSKEIKNNIHIHAPVSGTVMEIGARQGKHVTPMTELYTIVDLNQVWVFAYVYEYELPWVKEGDQATMTLASVPGKVFKGRIDYIYPYAEVSSRTTKVRMVFDNKQLLLRPDMFADVQIKADVQKSVVVIPSEAVVRSGTRTQVFIAKTQGKFEPREVSVGVDSNGQVVVYEGLHEGEKVVTSAQFLIDSESKLREATAKMKSPGPMTDETSTIEKSEHKSSTDIKEPVHD